MSRSFKHTPGYTCGYGTRSRSFYKKISNRVNRRKRLELESTDLKRNGFAYDICDYKFLYFTRQDFSYSLSYPEGIGGWVHEDGHSYYKKALPHKWDKCLKDLLKEEWKAFRK